MMRVAGLGKSGQPWQRHRHKKGAPRHRVHKKGAPSSSCSTRTPSTASNNAARAWYALPRRGPCGFRPVVLHPSLLDS